jgi:hypothetical protein
MSSYVVTPQAAEVTQGGDYGPAVTKVGIKVGPTASSAPSSGPGVAALTHRAQGALGLGACMCAHGEHLEPPNAHIRSTPGDKAL